MTNIKIVIESVSNGFMVVFTITNSDEKETQYGIDGQYASLLARSLGQWGPSQSYATEERVIARNLDEVKAVIEGRLNQIQGRLLATEGKNDEKR